MNICFSISDINWTITKDVITIIGTIAAITIGSIGLTTWRKQLKANHNLDLSKRTLVLFYKYFSTIEKVRNCIYQPFETGTYNSNTELTMFEKHCNAYNYRWQQVNEIRNLLDAELIECEAVWDNYPKQLIEKFFAIQTELESCTRNHLEHLDPSSSQDIKSEALKRRDINILYVLEEDSFGKKIDSTFYEIKLYFKDKFPK